MRWVCYHLIGVLFWASALEVGSPTREPISHEEGAFSATTNVTLKVKYLKTRLELQEPPTDHRLLCWMAYFIISCFLGDDQTVVSTSILGLFKDIAMIRECDLGALTYCLYLWGLCCFSRRDTISFHDF